MSYFSRAAILFATVSAGASVSDLSCKCIHSQPCWPSLMTWSSLNESLAGRLVPTALPTSVCPNGGETSETYSVNATEAEHVQTALLFAREHNLKVNVNNTGHAGASSMRSSTCGALFIQTHYMKGIEFHTDYSPQSCPRNVTHMAATLGAGEQDDDVFQSLAKYDAVTVGGTYNTVGIVGWAKSGGHGWLTGSYGQGADNIYEVEVVTPTGEILVANECQNTDIFWATRGGGGGTYGVISKITMKAYPMPQTTQWMWNIASENATSAADWWMLVAELHVMLNDLNEQGFQGYYTMTGPATGPWTFGGFFMAYDMPNSTVQDNLAPFTSKLDDLRNLASVSSWNVTKYATWIEAYNSLPKQVADTSDGPGGVVSVTRLLQRDDLTTDLDASAKMFASIGPQTEEAKLGISNHIMAGSMTASPAPVDNALNPAWRTTAVHMIIKASWTKSLSPEQVHRIQNYMTNKVGRAMRKMSPDSGCYVNECDQYEPDWQWALYGPNYARLRAIKEKYDPDGILWCRRCVGSEEWEYDEGVGGLCRRGVSDEWKNYGLPSSFENKAA